MPGTITPAQMYDHECNVIKGWFDMNAVDKSADLASGEVINKGAVCYLDSTAKFRLGLPDNVQGCFAMRNSAGFDVAADVGNVQKQVMNALPTVASYELYTTEYDTSYTYNINEYLTAWDAQLIGYTAAKRGLVRYGKPYHHTLVGQVSGTVATNEYGKSYLTLWTYHLPVDLDVTSSIHD